MDGSSFPDNSPSVHSMDKPMRLLNSKCERDQGHVHAELNSFPRTFIGINSLSQSFSSENFPEIRTHECCLSFNSRWRVFIFNFRVILISCSRGIARGTIIRVRWPSVQNAVAPKWNVSMNFSARSMACCGSPHESGSQQSSEDRFLVPATCVLTSILKLSTWGFNIISFSLECVLIFL